MNITLRELGSKGHYEGISISSGAPSLYTSIENTAERREILYFSVFGDDAEDVYYAVKDLVNEDQSPAVRLASRKGGSSTDTEMLLEVVNLIITYLDTFSDSTWQEAISDIQKELDKGNEIPWNIQTASMKTLTEAYREMNKPPDNLMSGDRVTKPCPHNNCGGMYVVETFLASTSSDDIQGHRGVCTTCGNVRRGYRIDYATEEKIVLETIREEEEYK